MRLNRIRAAGRDVHSNFGRRYLRKNLGVQVRPVRYIFARSFRVGICDPLPGFNGLLRMSSSLRGCPRRRKCASHALLIGGERDSSRNRRENRWPCFVPAVSAPLLPNGRNARHVHSSTSGTFSFAIATSAPSYGARVGYSGGLAAGAVPDWQRVGYSRSGCIVGGRAGGLWNSTLIASATASMTGNVGRLTSSVFFFGLFN